MPQHPEPQQLFQAFVDFTQAMSLPQSKRVLEQHPELLGDEVDALVGRLAATQKDKGTHDLVESYRTLLQRCRSVGVGVAFAEIERTSQTAILLAKFHKYFLRAQKAEQRYQSTGQGDALDAAISEWECILTHATFSETPEAFRSDRA